MSCPGGTGLRWSEVAALNWGDLRLDGSARANLVHELRAERKKTAPDDGRLVFINEVGRPLNYGNMLRRVLKPALREADASWAAFHTFRHTYASMLFEQGATWSSCSGGSGTTRRSSR